MNNEVNIEELERLARNATPGPWKACGTVEQLGGDCKDIIPTSVSCMAHCYGGSADRAEDKDLIFIAAANPFAILSLLDRLKKAEAERDALAAQPVNARMLEALLYWRDECSGAEPSIRAFSLIVDDAIAAAESAPKAVRLTDAEILSCESDDWDMFARAEAALAEPQPDADGWIPWASGPCPVDPDDLVEVKLRDGEEFIGNEAQDGGEWIWEHDGGPGDIMFYRVVEAQP